MIKLLLRQLIHLLELALILPETSWKEYAHPIAYEKTNIVFVVKLDGFMNFKLLLSFLRKSFDLDVLSWILLEKLLVSGSSNEELLSCFQYKAVFGDRVKNEAKQHHHDICNSSKFSK